MLALLLTAALFSPVTPRVTVPFEGRSAVTVTGPTNLDDAAGWSPPWSHEQTLYAPDGKAATVRFCWKAVKYHGCRVYLARPSLAVLELKNSSVTRLLWSEDGKYLIGAGENTVRLWNLRGTVRTAVPAPAEAAGRTQPRSSIQRLWLRERALCVGMRDDWFGGNGHVSHRTVTTTRFTLPGLKPLTVTTLGDNRKEAECSTP